MVAALMAHVGDDGARARWKSEGEEQAGEKDLEGCRRGLGDSSLSPRRCGGVGRRAGQAGTARGVRPRSVEQKRRGKTTRGGGRCWAAGPIRPAGPVGQGPWGAGGFSFLLLSFYLLFIFLFCFISSFSFILF